MNTIDELRRERERLEALKQQQLKKRQQQPAQVIDIGTARQASQSARTMPPSYQDTEADCAPPDETPSHPVSSFPLGVFPGDLQDYAEALAVSLQVPLDLVVVTMLSALMACAQARLSARVRGADWAETVVAQTLIFAPPSLRKSGVYKELMEPLVHYDEQQRREYKLAVDRIEQARAAVIASIADDKKEQLAALEQEESDLPPVKRTLVNDVTPEMLRTLLLENEESVTIGSPDGNPFERYMGRYKQGSQDELNYLLMGYDGERLSIDRVGSAQTGGQIRILLRNPHVGMIAMSQLVTMQDLVTGTRPGQQSVYRSRGALSRLMFYVAPPRTSPRDLRAPPVDEQLVTAYRRAARQLLELPRTRRVVEFDRDEPWFYRLEKYLDVETINDGALTGMEDWAGKHAGRMVRLATVLREIGGGREDMWELSMFLLDQASRVLRQSNAVAPAALLFDEQCAKFLGKMRAHLPRARFTVREACRLYPGRARPVVDEIMLWADKLQSDGHVNIQPIGPDGARLAKSLVTIELRSKK